MLKKFFTILGISAGIALCGLVIIIPAIFGLLWFFSKVGFAHTTAEVLSISTVVVIIVGYAGAKFSHDIENKIKLDYANKEKIFLSEQERIQNEAKSQIAWERQQLTRRAESLLIYENKIKAKEADFQRLVSTELQNYPWLATLYSDYVYATDKKISTQLRNKKHPAPSAADQVSAIAKEKRTLQKELKMYEYQFEFLQEALPWLEEYMELDPREAYEIAVGESEGDEETYEKYRNWLSPTEYKELPTAEKYQLALDRYIKQPKTNWEAGIIYERYIGYLCEMNGYKVDYIGALKKKEDMGRDIIAKRGNDVYIIQCKRYKADREIHENVVFQTYGTTVQYQIEHPNDTVIASIITTAKLSEIARKCADYLSVKYTESKELDKSYPLIKCNISRNGEKIYHLPFDQQYDKIKIEKDNGEFYSHTIAEAEANGFRRAFKWRGNSENQ